MAYFKIGDVDFSPYTSGLVVNKAANYSAQTNAAGNTVVDLINSKVSLDVTIIPLKNEVMNQLKAEIDKFAVNVTYLNPATNELTTIAAIIPDNSIEYYTIRPDWSMFKPITLTFTEL